MPEYWFTEALPPNTMIRIPLRKLLFDSMNNRSSSFESLDKGDLHKLCNRLLTCEAEAIEQCIAFIEAETFGIWHGRARAMMARRLKHCPLSKHQSTRVVRVILQRFVSGRFSEQFKDQLRLALHLAPTEAFAAARACQSARLDHVRRYAKWVLLHDANG